MDDLPGLMADFGFRQQGKSAPMSTSKPSSGSGSKNPLPFDDIFSGFKGSNPNPKSSSMPVYDKPVYDDDIFDGVPGIKSSTYDDVFGSMSKRGHVDKPGAYDDLLGGLGKKDESSKGESMRSEDLGGFEELIPGFGGSSPRMRSETPETNQHHSAGPSAKQSATMSEDPFVFLESTSASTYSSSGMFTDPLENLVKPKNSGSANVDASPVSGGVFDDIDAFDGLAKSSSYASEEISRKDKSPQKFGNNGTRVRSSMEFFDNVIPKTRSTRSFDSRGSFQSPKSNDIPYDRNATVDQSPKSFEHLETADDVWLTVSEIPLFTQPISAPPPSRPPPPLVIKSSSVGMSEPRRMDNESYSQSTASYPYSRGSVRKTSVTPFDELEGFAMGKPQSNEHVEVFSNENNFETNSTAEASAAAMKEAMDRAEAKFRHAKEVRERERDARLARSKEDERTMSDTDDLEDKERQEILENERLQREREERGREQRRLEKEREEKEREEHERAKARQAVERATREARQRAAAEARLRAERAAVEKTNAEARQRAERAAVQRAAAEARDRAAAEARERAERAAAETRERTAAEARERAAAEARERAAAEAREKAARERAAEARDKAASEARDRAAVGRATAEARLRAERAAVERAAAEARERAAAAAREKQNRTENDLESFFGMGARANSAPKQRATTSENIFDTQAQSRGSADAARRTSSTSSTIRKASSATNIVDDLTSIFGGAPSSGEFQEVEGETEERRKARLERHQRTLERAAKALAEKNERDMQTQRDQAERHRIAETLDIEIKRWASGKEGNLRALLSTLQYVLWPECGWQPVSLTDLITAAAVKKVYRKATLCIHPDKVQQKGANLQQKYIAEKVFDLLKEAWNKFNSEELF